MFVVSCGGGSWVVKRGVISRVTTIKAHIMGTCDSTDKG